MSAITWTAKHGGAFSSSPQDQRAFARYIGFGLALFAAAAAANASIVLGILMASSIIQF